MKRIKYRKLMFVQNKLAITTQIKMDKPVRNIGLRPMMSAALGSINDPTKHPEINDDPIKPILASLTQYRSIYSTQLCNESTLLKSIWKLRPAGKLHATVWVHGEYGPSGTD
jgi:hypothetical protein